MDRKALSTKTTSADARATTDQEADEEAAKPQLAVEQQLEVVERQKITEGDTVNCRVSGPCALHGSPWVLFHLAIACGELHRHQRHARHILQQIANASL